MADEIINGLIERQVEKALTEAVAAERERCAKVCEEIASYRTLSSAAWLRHAAEEIRKGE